MPPSRDLTFVINEDEKARLEKHLGIEDTPYRVTFKSNPSGRTQGCCNPPPSRLIVIELGAAILAQTRLSLVHDSIIDTLLHEFRHAHQFETWDIDAIIKDQSRAYAEQKMEADARDFAARGVSEWRKLGRVKSRVSSPFRRLSATERTVRA